MILETCRMKQKALFLLFLDISYLQYIAFFRAYLVIILKALQSATKLDKFLSTVTRATYENSDKFRVSNGTGQCNFSGQRDRQKFFVPGQRDNGTVCPGTSRPLETLIWSPKEEI